MKVVIVTATPFPEGGGETTRVYYYAKGLTANSVDVEVLSIRPKWLETLDALKDESAGVIDGIPFQYIHTEKKREQSFIKRQWRKLQGIQKFVSVIKRIDSQQKIDCIVTILADYVLWHYCALAVSKLLSTVCIGDRGEFPFIYHSPSFSVRLRLALFQLICRFYDGMIACSTFLQRYLQQITKGKTPVLLIPTLTALPEHVEPEIPGFIEHDAQRIKWCYYVTGSAAKQETIAVLKTILDVSYCYPNIGLKLVGPFDIDDYRDLFPKPLFDSWFTQHVNAVGKVPREDLFNQMASTDICLMPRSNGIFSKAGFPTKIVEYLASGKPVITTAVGDIPYYLKNGHNAYIVPPDDHALFVEKLLSALSDPTTATNIGKRGYEIANRHFEYKRNCLKIKGFIVALINNGQY